MKRFILFLNSTHQSDKKFRATLKQIIGSSPKNMDLYKQAFMHSSTKEKKAIIPYNNERLEFLGDAILGAIIGEYLFKKFPQKDEGFLTQLRSKIVNRKNLHQLALKFGLNDFLKANLSKQDKLKSSAFGDAFEALIGAVYMDLGYEKTKKFVINKIVKLHIDLDELLNLDSDYKSQLQVYCQKNKFELQYITTEETSKNNSKFYKVHVKINDKTYDAFEHYNKKSAEQKAAQIALENISNG